MADELAVGDFVVRQRKLKLNEALRRSYDLVVAGLSWESRGPTALGSVKGLDAPLTLLKFKSRSQDVEAAKAAQLEVFQKLRADLGVKELGASTEADKNFASIKTWLQDLYAKTGRPLSILLDMTCIPKTYVLYLIGLGFSDELIARMDCLYTPGKYDLVSGGAGAPPALTGPPLASLGRRVALPSNPLS